MKSPGIVASHERIGLIAALIIVVGAIAMRAEDEANKKLSSAGVNEPASIGRIERDLLIDPFLVYGVASRTESLQEAMEKNRIPALSIAVIDSNRIVWAKAYGISEMPKGVPVNIHTLFSAGSLSKLITAIAVLRLVDRGQLGLDVDISQYLKSWRLPQNTGGVPITLRQLLSHTSGIAQHFPVTYALDAKLPTTLDILKGQPPARSPAIKIAGKPGEAFDYSSAAFSVVQEVIEEVTKKPFADVVKEQVLEPTGMIESTFEQPTASNYLSRAVGHISTAQNFVSQPAVFAELATAGLWTTPSDLARLLIRLQEPPRLLPENLFKEMVSPVKENSGLGVFVAGEEAGLRFRARTSDGRPIDGFCGWLTSYIGTGKGAVIMANSHSAFNTGFALLRSVAREYKWPGYLTVLPGPSKPINLQAYVGKYQLDSPVVITKENNSLFVSYAELEKLPLLPSGNGSFVVNFEAVSDFVLSFHMGTNGKADKLTLSTRFRRFEAPRIAEPANASK